MDILEPYLRDTDLTVYVGDARDVLRTLPDGSVDCVITSPPYYGLRDYNTPGQLGLEPTLDNYVTNMVAVFREVHRVLADHGTVWCNLGDSYNANVGAGFNANARVGQVDTRVETGLAAKQLLGVPWRVAFALQDDGWWLRSDIIWSKPNPMPESVTDRPTKAHEYVFLLAKRPRYWFDAEAVREPAEWARWGDQTYSPEAEAMYGQRIPPRKKGDLTQRRTAHYNTADRYGAGNGGNSGFDGLAARMREGEHRGRNVRSVWEIATQPYPEAHFATFPEELVRRCLLAGCPESVCRECARPRERIVEATGGTIGESWHDHSDDAARGNAKPTGESVYKTYRRDTAGWTDCGHNNWRPGIVLDPFLGSGTTAKIARNHGRHCVGIELNPDYVRLAANRTQQLSLLDTR